MNFSIDLVFLGINLILLAFSYGSFSEQIKQLKESLKDIKESLTRIDGHYYPNKDGLNLEKNQETMWQKIDELPCKECKLNGKNGL